MPKPTSITDLLAQIQEQLSTLQGAARLVVLLCTAATLLAVAINFQLAENSRAVESKKRSLVETGSMLGFLFVFYLLIRFHLGVHVFISIYPLAAIFGIILLLVGTTVNIMGRFNLGQNWGNQVIIYQDHTLVTGGVYRWVRHPLYASLIWMFIGASLIFQNWASLFATLLVFVPAMYFRGKQEEAALICQFPAYAEYRKKTGMFFPYL